MRTAILALSLLLAGALGAQTTQPADDVVIYVGYAGKPPSNSVPFTRLVDLDNNGTFANATELIPYMEKTFNTSSQYAFIEDLAQVIEEGRIVWYVADSGGSYGDAYILRVADANGDGFIQPAEGMIYADFGKGSGSGYSPDAVAAIQDHKGRFALVSSHDHTAWRGLWKSVDLNRDGDALDQGETTKWADGNSSLTVPVTGSSPVPLQFNYPVNVRTGAKDEVLYYQQGSYSTPGADENCWFALKEDAQGKVQVRNFFNPSSLNQLDRNVDLAGGKIVNLDLKWTTTSGTNRINDLSLLAVAPGSFKGRDAYYFATSCGAQRSWGNQNLNGTVVMGLVFRGIDNNQDGDLNDAGEVNLFYNGSGATLAGGVISGQVKPASYYDALSSGQVTKCDSIWGISVVGEVVYLIHAGATGNTGAKAVLRLEDKNQNFKIETGEATQVFAITSPWPSFWASQYGPYINGIQAVHRTHLPEPQPDGIAPYGQACPGSNGYAPLAWSRGGKPLPGNLQFQLVASRAPAGKVGFLAIGNSNRNFGVVPLPFDLAFLGATGCHLNTNIVLLNQALVGTGGVAAVNLPIPPDPALKGAALYGQYLLLDTQANPANLVTTDGVAITVQ